MPSTQRGGQEKGRLGPTEWVGLVAVAAGIPTALIAGRPVSTILLLIALSVAIPIFAWRILSRLPKSRFTFRNAILTIIATLIVPGCFAALIATPATRDTVLTDLVGVPEPDTPAVLNSQVSTVGVDHLIRVAIRNPSDTERVVTRLSVSWSSDDDRNCARKEPYHFKIKDMVTITSSVTSKTGSHETQIEASVVPTGPEADNALEEQIAATGSIGGSGCGGQQWGRIAFAPTVLLPPKEVTLIEVQVPERFIGDRARSGSDVQKQQQQQLNTLGHNSGTEIGVTIDREHTLTLCTAPVRPGTKEWRPCR